MKKLIMLLACFVCAVGFSSLAAALSFDSDTGISAEELRVSIRRSTNLTDAQVNALIATLETQFQVTPEQKIPIQGYLYSRGMNGAFFVDRDTWAFDATLKDPATGELVDIPELFLVDFHNGGLKMEVAYKWMFTFIPKGVTVAELNGGVYGRGLGVVFESFFGLEGAWMPAQSRHHDLFHVAIKLGFGAGITFPKMEFKLRSPKARPTSEEPKI